MDAVLGALRTIPWLLPPQARPTSRKARFSQGEASEDLFQYVSIKLQDLHSDLIDLILT